MNVLVGIEAGRVFVAVCRRGDILEIVGGDRLKVLKQCLLQEYSCRALTLL